MTVLINYLLPALVILFAILFAILVVTVRQIAADVEKIREILAMAANGVEAPSKTPDVTATFLRAEK